jgi:flagellar basal body rod protein FlgG
METLDVLANNLANTTSPGFKADREFYSLYLAPEATSAGIPTTLPVVEQSWADLSQGAITPTGNPLDLALSGKGFFAVDGQGGPLYTRNGSFRISPAGRLETADGHAVRARGGRPIQIDSSAAVEIDRNGTLRQGGQVVAELEIVEPTSSAALEKRSGSYYRLVDSRAAAPASGYEVHQGRLEASNVGAAETGVRLVAVLRQFETLQRALTLAGEMNRRAVEEVAKSGG